MRVLITDGAWPDWSIEEEVFGSAGLDYAVARDSTEGALVPLAGGSEAIMTCFAQVTARVIAAPPRLAIVARFGTGVDMIDCEAAWARGAVVTNVRDYCSTEVAEHALALIFDALRRVTPFDRSLRSGGWRAAGDVLPARVAGRTLGIVGFGAIGRELARLGEAVGMRVLVHSRRPDVGTSSLDRLLAESDVVSLHVPAEPDTIGMVDRAFLESMKPGAWLVNTSRGTLVDEECLVESLRGGRLGGAALDVFAGEPLAAGSPLRSLPNVILTPHVAFYSEEAVATMRRRACEEVVRVLVRGEAPLSPVPRRAPAAATASARDRPSSGS
jgi:D-3-phosphoglycerate dehydrogenase